VCGHIHPTDTSLCYMFALSQNAESSGQHDPSQHTLEMRVLRSMSGGFGEGGLQGLSQVRT
jgi:hypothetical protein